MTDAVLAVGPPPLTQLAADCAIDVIDFMAAEARGVDLIDVTPAVRDAWRTHLARYYPMLTPMDRYWFANAPFTLTAIQSSWQQLPEPHRMMYRQAWAAALPGMLQLVDPVLQATGPAAESLGTSSVANFLDERTGDQRRREEAAMAAGDEAAVAQELFNHSMNIQTLTNMSNVGTSNTIGLVQAYNRMS
jgi:hypothetical protein